MLGWFRGRKPPSSPPLERYVPKLGRLKWSRAVSSWLKTEKTALPLFDGAEIMLSIELAEAGAADPLSPEAVAATVAFLQLGPEAREAITPHVWLNYTEFRDAAGELPVTIARPEDVWRHMVPTHALVAQGLGSRRWHVMLSCDCFWAERGLQLVLRDGVRWVRVANRRGSVTDGEQFNLPALDAWADDPDATLPLRTARALEEAVKRGGANWDLLS
jgi:hypothetical protein